MNYKEKFKKVEYLEDLRIFSVMFFILLGVIRPISIVGTFIDRSSPDNYFYVIGMVIDIILILISSITFLVLNSVILKKRNYKYLYYLVNLVNLIIFVFILIEIFNIAIMAISIL